MDTKWKKWKGAGSLIAFLLGLYLLFLSVIPGGAKIAAMFLYGNGMADIREELETDYQNTYKFRWFVSSRLEELLLMACKGNMGDYSGEDSVVIEGTYDGWKWENLGIWDSWFSWARETTLSVAQFDAAASEAVLESTEEYDYHEDYGYDSEGQKRTPLTREERIQKRQEQLAPDKNVLYHVSYDGESLYTNAEGIALDETGRSMPEGYNFLLYFDGEKTHIYKDGTELDDYSGDYYELGVAQWYVPGYYNFYVDEASKKARVIMAVAENPRLYVKGQYSEYGNEEYGSNLYWMKRSKIQRREEFIRSMALFFLGLMLLMAALALRKQKKTADLWLSRRTKKCWLEIKLLACLGIPLGLGWVKALLPVTLVLLYVLVNDLWQNRGQQRSILKNLWKILRESLRTRSLRLPLQKRMVYRLWAALSCWLLAAAFLGNAVWAGYGAYEAESIFCYILLTLGALMFVLALVLSIRFALYHKRTAEDIGALGEKIAAVRNGNLAEGMKVPKDNDLHQMAENLNTIQQGMNRAMEEQMKSERMKVELLSNVSHDIKTPLTSIISYVELLKQEEGLPEHVKDYIQILGRKSERLKTMVQDVFEVSKASSGQLPVKMETLDLHRLISQTLADMDEQVRKSGMVLKAELPAGEVFVYADGQRMYRVIQNLLQNALNYSLPGSRIHVTLLREGHQATVRIQNVSRIELASGVDFTERFVRGDASRTDGGSGLGLSIARSFTEACGGEFRILVNADLFTAEISLAVQGQEAD